MKRLENKIAVITGGAMGIGKTTVEKFVKEGAAVTIWDVDEKNGKEFTSQLKLNGFNVFFKKVNVANHQEIDKAVKEVVERFGRIDILINNAGITKDSTLKKMTQEQWQQVIDVNLTGVFNCTQAVASIMLEQGAGKIISASSVVGLYGNFGQSNYAATKSGIIGMTKVWARELGRKGINVNAVAPGFIETEMVKKMPQDVVNIMKDKIPLGRLGTTDDIANAYLFLASEEANYINGTVLSIDGGMIP